MGYKAFKDSGSQFSDIRIVLYCFSNSTVQAEIGLLFDFVIKVLQPPKCEIICTNPITPKTITSGESLIFFTSNFSYFPAALWPWG